MNKEDFFQNACINAIRILKPAYWDDRSGIDKGVDLVIEFAQELTEKVFQNSSKWSSK